MSEAGDEVIFTSRTWQGIFWATPCTGLEPRDSLTPSNQLNVFTPTTGGGVGPPSLAPP